MNRTIFRPLCIALAAAIAEIGLPVISPAQTLLFTAEGGQRSDDHMNGVANTSYFGGIGISAVLAGGAGKRSAFVFPVAGEMRYSNMEYIDLNLFADAAARLGPLTAGGGLVFSFDNVPDIPDAVAGGDEGTVIVINPLSFGYSGAAKLSLGPQGRFFVQARYISLPADYSYPFRTAQTDQIYADNNLAREDVTQQDSYSTRFAVGYVFTKLAIRLQYISEVWRYDPIYGNSTGAYDRDAKIFSLGATIY